jgi:hypothetical protein
LLLLGLVFCLSPFVFCPLQHAEEKTERNFTDALDATALPIRPDEKPFSWDISEEWARGSWLMRQLEDPGFENRVTVKSVEIWRD